MVLSVRLFAGLRERLGAAAVDVELAEPATAADLLAALDLPPRSCVVAINREYAGPDAAIVPGDEVALIPPVSGGADAPQHARIVDTPLDVAALCALVGDPRAGAVVAFQGVTREVERLDYEAYAEMAEPRMQAIVAQEITRHGLCAAAVEHRIGAVALGEASVVVAVSAAHRAEAFEGARAILDRVKAEAPVWKKEVDGTREAWVAGTLPSPDGEPDDLGDERLDR